MVNRRIAFLLVLFVLFTVCGATGQEVEPIQTPSQAIDAIDRVQTESAVVSEPAQTESQTPFAPEAEPGSDETALMAEEERVFHVDISGLKTWSLRYGFGHPLGLALAGISGGQFDLDQTLSVDFTAEALEVLSVVAHLDDQESDVMQSLAIYLDTERLDGVFGDFSLADMAGVAAYDKKMLGLRLDYHFGDATLTAVASQFEGISESQTFTGETASDEIEYAAMLPDQPWVESSYHYHIDGLYGFELESPYVEGFTDARLEFGQSSALNALLESYGLGFLVAVLKEYGFYELDGSDFTTIDDGMVLLLDSELADFIREILEEAVDVYNDGRGEDEESGTYPFVVDSEYELDFLGQLAAYLWLDVDGNAVKTSQAIRQRYYDLGTTDVVESSVFVELSFDGVTYRAIYVPQFSDYSIIIHASEGILECDFPDEFFASDAPAIRVDFDYYALTSGYFILGLSLIPESELVYLNDELLERDTDYYIDYDSGLLVLDDSISITADDVLVVEYEVYSGGLGGGSDYASYFYGLALDLPLGDLGSFQASILRSQDNADSAEDADTAETMPNQQTIVAVSADLSWDDFSTRISIGYNDELFPFDDNLRDNDPNEITEIVSFSKYLVLGHLDGFNVYVDGSWRAYDTTSGLSGNSVRGIAVGEDAIYFATESGLTAVSRDGVSPLDRVDNWTYYDEGDGPPDGSIRSVEVVDDILWLGTDAGVASVPVDEITDKASWTVYDEGAFATLDPVLTIVGDDSILYFGTASGVYRFDVEAGELDRISGASVDEIHDLALDGDVLYAASDRGLRTYVDGIASSWVLEEVSIYAVRVVDDEVYAGTESGLVAVGEETKYHGGWRVTALGVGPEGRLWAGSRADEQYAFDIWRHETSFDEFDTFDNETALIDGRDPQHYADVSADEHHSQGLSATASFQQTQDTYSLYGAIVRVAPEYHAIGSLSRSDWTGWQIGADGDWGDTFSWSADHEYQMSDLQSDEPSARLENALSINWEPAWGPELAAMFRYEADNDDWMDSGPETTYVGTRLVLSDSLFADRVDLRLRWSDSYDIDHVDSVTERDTSLAAAVGIEILETLDVGFGWSRPVDSSAGVWDGSETWTWSASFSPEFGFGSLDVDYDGERYAELQTDEAAEWQNQIDIDFDLNRFAAGGWTISPGLSLTVAQEEDVTIDSRLSISSRAADWTISTILDAEIEGLGADVGEDLEKVKVTARYRGWDNVSPSVTVSAQRDASTYEGEVKAVYDYTLDGTLRWVPKPGTSENLSIGFDVEQSEDGSGIDLAIDNAFQTNVTPWIEAWLPAEDPSLPTVLSLLVDSSVDASLDDGEPDFDAATSASLGVSIGPMWGGSLGLAYYTGMKSAGGLYHSLLIELTISIDFVFSQ